MLKAHEVAAREMQRAHELLRQAESGERTAGQVQDVACAHLLAAA